ncbi:MAG: hypothetical protein K8S54_08655 [Spirochaetia bacterium]|nr:hypothetical protein [Spirochaetia bacterium]
MGGLRLLTLMLAVCYGGPALRSEDLTGTLGYLKDYDFSGKSRILEMDGTAVVGRVTLDYHSGPAGVHDGDGGTMFHFKVTAPEQIKEGTFVINQSIFQSRVAEWASPYGYDVMPGLKGIIRVRKYVKFRQLIADVDITYGTNPNKSYSGQIKFENHDFSKKLKGKIDWQSFDPRSIRSRANIQPSDIAGNWRAVDKIWESSGIIYGMLDPSLDPYALLEARTGVNGDTIHRSASGSWEKFTLRENVIEAVVAPPNENLRIVRGTINQIGTDTLTITWIETWKYEGNNFSSTQRLIYKRVPANIP